jgi:hypothetical protein
MRATKEPLTRGGGISTKSCREGLVRHGADRRQRRTECAYQKLSYEPGAKPPAVSDAAVTTMASPPTVPNPPEPSQRKSTGSPEARKRRTTEITDRWSKGKLNDAEATTEINATDMEEDCDVRPAEQGRT